MAQNIVEYLREEVIKQVLNTTSVKKAWPTWDAKIKTLIPANTEHQIYDLGDSLRDIFYTTNGPRTQRNVSAGGACWEALVCWYLNLCLIGRRTVVIKHNNKTLPPCVADAMTVNYGSFPSNTESDLIAITFPDKTDYTIDKEAIIVTDSNGNTIPTHKTKRSKYNMLAIVDTLCARDFNDIEIHIIQCKTNWNDNAQIPMLWDAVYSANTFRSGVTVGRNGYSISDAARFSYSFATVPTVQPSKFKKDSTPVLRVRSLSGGNYWGMKSATSIADSIKEMLNRNLKSGHTSNHLTTIKAAIPNLNTTYSYFQL